MNNYTPDQVIGFLVLVAEMKTVSPLRIGNGQSEKADVDIIRLPDGSPYLPASSLVGALAHRFEKEVDLGDKASALAKAGEIFWGTPQTRSLNQASESWQSHLRISDILLEPPGPEAVTVRDGVKIDEETNTAKEGMKFDYELLEPGHTFTLKAEVTLRAGFKDKIDQMGRLLGYVKHCLENELRIGGMTTRGFGQVKCQTIRTRKFDFCQEETKDWFEYLKGEEELKGGDEGFLTPELPFKLRNHFSCHATFGLKSTLLIGAPPKPGDEVDQIPLQSEGRPVISGRSLAGAVRHRSYKILRTMGLSKEVAQKEIRKLFGWVENESSERLRPIKSRVTTHEAPIKGAQMLTQTRIRVNSFTSGSSRTGLFAQQEVTKKEGHQVQLRLDIEDPLDWEQALLLHVLKDLWTSDLAIGGGKSIGRGLLVGKHALISLGDDQLEMIGLEDRIELKGPAEAFAELQRAETALHTLTTSKNPVPCQD